MKLTAAQRGALTRSRRRNFTQTFSDTTVNVVKELLVRRASTQDISHKFDIPRTTVSTIKGNLTRGTYDDYLNVSLTRDGEVVSRSF